ncbi:MAG TPA: 2Fe-2S iron-sulfur cluster-binding protein [Marmoricola sp.]|nr:2Fe-2S iron-sulfur cluster-binding protein [Marmoricola sp.]
MRPEFHALQVAAIDPLTEDSVALTLTVPEELRPAYAFTAGQHVAIRVPGDEIRRSYSLCSVPAAERLRIGVKRLPGGIFSEKVLDDLAVGDELEVMTPMGRFGAALAGLRRPAFVAAGSGITPVLPMVATALADPDVAEVTLVDCNRTQRDVMFLDELADLKDLHPTRLQLVHVLTREPQESPLLSGRLDADRFRAIRSALVGEVDGWFVCGPFDLVTTVHEALVTDGVDPGAVHTELFHAEAPPVAPVVATPSSGTQVTATLGGLQSAFTVPPGEHVLDGFLRVRGDAPYACKGGVCGTCRARVLEGEVAMDANWALEPDEVERGYVLTCQSRPAGDRLVLDYDG